MTKKRKSSSGGGNNAAQPKKPWCWYCDREFDDEKVLIGHQKAKHFKCPQCHKKLNSASGLVIHYAQLHKDVMTRVPNAIPGHDTPELEIFGMEGVPPEDLQRHWDDLPIVEYKKGRLDALVNAPSLEPLILSPLPAPVPFISPAALPPINSPIITANPTVYPAMPPMMMMHHPGYPPYGYPYPPNGYPIPAPFYPPPPGMPPIYPPHYPPPPAQASDVHRKDEPPPPDRKRPLRRILIEAGWDERLGKAIPGMQIYAADLDISPEEMRAQLAQYRLKAVKANE